MKYMILVGFVSVVLARPGVPSDGYLPSVSDYSLRRYHPTVAREPSGGYLPGDYQQVGLYHSSDYGRSEYGYAHQELKDVYFYGSSQSPEYSRLRIHLAPAPSRTRVLFIKSPDAGIVVPEVIAPATRSEDRTLVYVLSKKQEAVGSITIPSHLGNNVVRTKPQVFYLRYNSPQDAERAVEETLSGKASGVGIRPVSDQHDFVRTLADTAHGGISGSLGSLGSYSSSGERYGTSGQGGQGVSSSSYDAACIESNGSSFGQELIGTGVPGDGSYGAPGASGPY